MDTRADAIRRRRRLVAAHARREVSIRSKERKIEELAAELAALRLAALREVDAWLRIKLPARRRE